MSTRPKGYGLSAEISAKLKGKYDVQHEQQARVWMEQVVGENIPGSDGSSEPMGPEKFQQGLKDGIFLCKLASVLTGKPIKTTTMKVAFKQMENIGKFLEAIEKYGVAKTDLFQTVDLYENQNMGQVVTCIHALGRKAQTNGFDGPTLGPKESARNTREFTEEQLKAGKNVIGLQMGSNKGASQAGMSMGTQRHINDIQCDDMSKEGANIIGLQAGSNAGANQSGISYGKSRGILGTDK